MRNLAIRLILWLCQRYDITVLDEARRVMSVDAKARSVQWEAFYTEREGLADMLAELRKEAFEAMAEVDPKDTDKIYYLATSDRNVRRLEQRIRGVIQSGKIEAANDAAKERLNGAPLMKSVR